MPTFEQLEILRRELGDILREDEPLADKTAYRTGGEALCYIEPGDLKQLCRAQSLLYELGLEFVVLGGGSNILVVEEGVRERVVLSLRKGFAGLDTVGGDQWSGTVRVESGVKLSRLVRYCTERGFAGLERLAGIPGTVGGAVAMNAGAYGQTIGDCLAALQTVIAGNLGWRGSGTLKRGYRDGGLETQEVVVAAYFICERRNRIEFEETVAEITALRRRRLPAGVHAGSVFKNPEGDFAGRLLEKAGCKGMSCGGARVAEKHANVIVAERGVTPSDIMILVERMRNRVYEQFNISLETEIRVLS